MKTPLFFVAALAAFFTLPVDFTMTVSILFCAGLAAILVCDYRRDQRLTRNTARMYASVQQPERFRLAA
jgi:hypothetical protein